METFYIGFLFTFLMSLRYCEKILQNTDFVVSMNIIAEAWWFMTLSLDCFFVCGLKFARKKSPASVILYHVQNKEKSLIMLNG